MSIVVPAHNEARTIGRCLSALLAQTDPDSEIVVVCNGCSDATAEIARGFGPRVRVEVLPTASKIAALNHGDGAATRFPRLYVDADVELGAGAVAAIAARLDSDPVRVAAPAVRHDLRGASRLVRSYFAIWEALPSVRDDVVGRGAYALSAEARAMFGRFPAVVGDDHFIRDLFPPSQRAVVADAVSLVRAPRTLRGLLRRKVRAYTGNVELDRRSTAGRRRARRRAVQWLRVVRSRPALLCHVPLYVAVGAWPRAVVLTRRLLRRGSRWDRDDSSRHEAVEARLTR